MTSAATKHGMIYTLPAVVSTGRIDYGQTRAELVAIVRTFSLPGSCR